MSAPILRGHRPDPARTIGVVVLLHGGGEHGTERVRWWRPPVLRMVPFAWAILARARRDRGELGGDVAVLRLRNRVYGWNGPDASPVRDATAALDVVRTAYSGTPVVLVGHSMGGRVALRLAEEAGVAGVAALAPWIGDGDAPRGRPGQPVLLLHGRDDRITDPRRTTAYAARLHERGVDVAWHSLPDGHAMLRVAGRWQAAVADFVLRVLGDPDHREPGPTVNSE